MNLKPHLIATAALSVLAASTGWAANDTKAMSPTATTPAPMAAPMRSHADTREAERNELKQQLQAAQGRADYARIIEDHGYRIAAINEDKKDYLEYEVVKGKHSYEVQLDFDKGASKATEIAVENNLWRADATKKMLANADYKHPAPLKADPQSRYSDRRYIKAWTSEKDRLENALPPNQQVAQYKPKLEKMGYKITAVNDREDDYVEYEIAKGANSYEVQIDVDPKTHMATQVDVTSNLWEADATDRATDRAKK